MRKVRTQLLATAAVMALGSAAYAADMGVPMKAPPPAPIPYTNWQGFYVGGLIGVGRLNESAVVSDSSASKITSGALCGTYGASTCSYSATGVVGGVDVGYDWKNPFF